MYVNDCAASSSAGMLREDAFTFTRFSKGRYATDFRFQNGGRPSGTSSKENLRSTGTSYIFGL